MYNVHETTTMEPEREFSEKRQDDDRKTKQKMELIRSKLKTHARKVKLSPFITSFLFIFSGYSSKSSSIGNEIKQNKHHSSSSS